MPALEPDKANLSFSNQSQLSEAPISASPEKGVVDNISSLGSPQRSRRGPRKTKGVAPPPTVQASVARVIQHANARGFPRENRLAFVVVSVVGYQTLVNNCKGECLRNAMQIFHRAVTTLADSLGGYTSTRIPGAQLVVFSAADKALQFALELQNGMPRQSWSQELVEFLTEYQPLSQGHSHLEWRGLRAKCGISYGGPYYTKVDWESVSCDYAGPQIRLAAMAAGLAKMGEVLVTEQVLRHTEQDYQRFSGGLVLVSLSQAETELLGFETPPLWRANDVKEGGGKELRSLSLKDVTSWYQLPPPAPVGTVAVVLVAVPMTESLRVNSPEAVDRCHAMIWFMLSTLAAVPGREGYSILPFDDAEPGNAHYAFVFQNVLYALQFAVCVQLAALQLPWPQEVLVRPEGCPVYFQPAATPGEKDIYTSSQGGDGKLLYRGLPFRLAIDTCEPSIEYSVPAVRLDYSGPGIKECAKLLRRVRDDECLISPAVHHITQFETPFFGAESNDSMDTFLSDTSQGFNHIPCYAILPRSLSQRRLLPGAQRDVLLDMHNSMAGAVSPTSSGSLRSLRSGTGLNSSPLDLSFLGPKELCFVMCEAHVPAPLSQLAKERSLQVIMECMERLVGPCQGTIVILELGCALCTFKLPFMATVFALALQKELLYEKWPDELLRHPMGRAVSTPMASKDTERCTLWKGMRVRCAMHIGNLYTEAWTDDFSSQTFRGPTLVETATIMGAAHPGQTLVSEKLWYAVESNLALILHHMPVGCKARTLGDHIQASQSGFIHQSQQPRKPLYSLYMSTLSFRSFPSSMPPPLEAFTTAALAHTGAGIAGIAHPLLNSTYTTQIPPVGPNLVFVRLEVMNAAAIKKRFATEPEVWQESLQQYLFMLRRLLSVCGGYEIGSRETHVFCVFKESAMAVRFAIRLQSSLLHVTWPPPLLDANDMAGVVTEPYTVKILWRGLRVSCAIVKSLGHGTFCPVTERMQYEGPHLFRLHSMLHLRGLGEVCVDAAVHKEIVDMMNGFTRRDDAWDEHLTWLGEPIPRKGDIVAGKGDLIARSTDPTLKQTPYSLTLHTLQTRKYGPLKTADLAQPLGPHPFQAPTSLQPQPAAPRTSNQKPSNAALNLIPGQYYNLIHHEASLDPSNEPLAYAKVHNWMGMVSHPPLGGQAIVIAFSILNWKQVLSAYSKESVEGAHVDFVACLRRHLAHAQGFEVFTQGMTYLCLMRDAGPALKFCLDVTQDVRPQTTSNEEDGASSPGSRPHSANQEPETGMDDEDVDHPQVAQRRIKFMTKMMTKIAQAKTKFLALLDTQSPRPKRETVRFDLGIGVAHGPIGLHHDPDCDAVVATGEAVDVAVGLSHLGGIVATPEVRRSLRLQSQNLDRGPSQTEYPTDVEFQDMGSVRVFACRDPIPACWYRDRRVPWHPPKTAEDAVAFSPQNLPSPPGPPIPDEGADLGFLVGRVSFADDTTRKASVLQRVVLEKTSQYSSYCFASHFPSGTFAIATANSQKAIELASDLLASLARMAHWMRMTPWDSDLQITSPNEEGLGSITFGIASGFAHMHYDIPSGGFRYQGPAVIRAAALATSHDALGVYIDGAIYREFPDSKLVAYGHGFAWSYTELSHQDDMKILRLTVTDGIPTTGKHHPVVVASPLMSSLLVKPPMGLPVPPHGQGSHYVLFCFIPAWTAFHANLTDGDLDRTLKIYVTVVRTVATLYGGYLGAVKDRHWYFWIFPDPEGVMNAAISIQERLLGAEWPHALQALVSEAENEEHPELLDKMLYNGVRASVAVHMVTSLISEYHDATQGFTWSGPGIWDAYEIAQHTPAGGIGMDMDTREDLEYLWDESSQPLSPGVSPKFGAPMSPGRKTHLEMACHALKPLLVGLRETTLCVVYPHWLAPRHSRNTRAQEVSPNHPSPGWWLPTTKTPPDPTTLHALCRVQPSVDDLTSLGTTSQERVLRSCCFLVRWLLSTSRGYEVSWSPSPACEFLLAFSHPNHANSFASGLHMALEEWKWPKELPNGLGVGVTIHAGCGMRWVDPWTTRYKYYGPTLSTLNAMASVCEKKETIYTETVRTHLRDTMDPCSTISGNVESHASTTTEIGILQPPMSMTPATPMPLYRTVPSPLASRIQGHPPRDPKEPIKPAQDLKNNHLYGSSHLAPPQSLPTIVCNECQPSKQELVKLLGPQVAQEVVELYHGVYGRILSYCGGWESSLDPNGFGMCSVFHSPKQAVKFCLMLQVALHAVPWPDALSAAISSPKKKKGNRTLMDAPKATGPRPYMGIHMEETPARSIPSTWQFLYEGEGAKRAWGAMCCASAGEVAVSHTVLEVVGRESLKNLNLGFPNCPAWLKEFHGAKVNGTMGTMEEQLIRIVPNALAHIPPTTILDKTFKPSSWRPWRVPSVSKAPQNYIYMVFANLHNREHILNHCDDVAWRSAFQIYRLSIRHLLAEFGGYEVGSNPGGEFFIVFHTLRNAVEFAIRIQYVLAEKSWPPSLSEALMIDSETGNFLNDETYTDTGLRVGIAIHAGFVNQYWDPKSERWGYDGGEVAKGYAVGRTGHCGEVVVTQPIFREMSTMDIVIGDCPVTTHSKGAPFQISTFYEYSVDMCLYLIQAGPVMESIVSKPLKLSTEVQGSMYWLSSISDPPPAPMGKVTVVAVRMWKGKEILTHCGEEKFKDCVAIYILLVRSILGQCKGYEASYSHQGDHTFVMMFDSPTDALNFAMRLQWKALNTPWPDCLLSCPRSATKAMDHESNDSFGLNPTIRPKLTHTQPLYHRGPNAPHRPPTANSSSSTTGSVHGNQLLWNGVRICVGLEVEKGVQILPDHLNNRHSYHPRSMELAKHLARIARPGELLCTFKGHSAIKQQLESVPLDYVEEMPFVALKQKKGKKSGKEGKPAQQVPSVPVDTVSIGEFLIPGCGPQKLFSLFLQILVARRPKDQNLEVNEPLDKEFVEMLQKHTKWWGDCVANMKSLVGGYSEVHNTFVEGLCAKEGNAPTNASLRMDWSENCRKLGKVTEAHCSTSLPHEQYKVALDAKPPTNPSGVDDIMASMTTGLSGCLRGLMQYRNQVTAQKKDLKDQIAAIYRIKGKTEPASVFLPKRDKAKPHTATTSIAPPEAPSHSPPSSTPHVSGTSVPSQSTQAPAPSQTLASSTSFRPPKPKEVEEEQSAKTVMLNELVEKSELEAKKARAPRLDSDLIEDINDPSNSLLRQGSLASFSPLRPTASADFQRRVASAKQRAKDLNLKAKYPGVQMPQVRIPSPDSHSRQSRDTGGQSRDTGGRSRDSGGPRQPTDAVVTYEEADPETSSSRVISPGSAKRASHKISESADAAAPAAARDSVNKAGIGSPGRVPDGASGSPIRRFNSPMAAHVPDPSDFPTPISEQKLDPGAYYNSPSREKLLPYQHLMAQVPKDIQRKIKSTIHLLESSPPTIPLPTTSYIPKPPMFPGLLPDPVPSAAFQRPSTARNPRSYQKPWNTGANRSSSRPQSGAVNKGSLR